MTPRTYEILKYFKDQGKVEAMQKALECAWRLHWWRRPHGRAFEVVMCELKRRLLGAGKMKFNTTTCEMECGDGKWINVINGYNNL